MNRTTVIRRSLLFLLVLALLLAYGLMTGIHPVHPVFISPGPAEDGFEKPYLPSYMSGILFDIPIPEAALQVSAAENGLTLKSGEGETERSYSAEGSDYTLYINDEEDLLSDSEEEDLLNVMKPITEYGNVAFMTTQISNSDYEGATGDIYHSLFNKESGTIFLIDMNHRQLIIFSDGAVYQVITRNYADTITDNIYKMARDGNYYGCAEEAFTEIHTLLSGYKIAQPMRHITNAMLAVILSALILYFIARRSSRQRAARANEVMSVLGSSCSFTDGDLTYSHQDRVYNPHDSDSGSGGGGGGGGGSSGGGGSHGF